MLPKFTNIKLHNEAVQREGFTRNFRRNLVEHELSIKKRKLAELRRDYCDKSTFINNIADEQVRNEIETTLNDQLKHYKKIVDNRTQRKLCRLYGGWVPLPLPSDGYINLSSAVLTEDQKELLNLGLNYAYSPRFCPLKKQMELELLYQDICRLKAANKITVNPDIQLQLQAESTRNRSHLKKPSLPARLRRAAKELKNNEDIIVRRADKAQIFVVMDRQDYLQKVDSILSDTSKFKKVTRNPIDELKDQANHLIKAANKHMTSKIDVITGDFKAGYFYGNVKNHKTGYPLRPIISQIPLPTYKLAKTLNKILSPYVPTTHSLKSSSEFIDLIKNNGKRGMLASMDVTSLFTNVPVDETIDILTRYAYETEGMDAPEMPRHVMKSMLRLCTKKAPFISPKGDTFIQVDGVAMGSPLGVIFAQAYMASVEEKILKNDKPYIYARYVDDIYLDIENEAKLQELKTRLEAEMLWSPFHMRSWR